MPLRGDARRGLMLPLPRFVLRPLTALAVAGVHVYLAAGHFVDLFGGAVQWTHIWKGFGALAGAYVFAAIASRGLSRREVADLTSAEAAQPAPIHQANDA